MTEEARANAGTVGPIPTTKDVFVQAVKDHLDGTPHAHHPVQFEPLLRSAVLMRCTLCRALVERDDAPDHRRWHDFHMREHERIMEQADRYVSPPRFG